jgi:GTPase SAR1 family protein
MKKGKSISIRGNQKIKVSYGTVDSKNFKSFFITIQSWVTPIKNEDNWSRIVMNFNRSIRHLIHDIIDNSIVDSNFIVDTDLRSSGLVVGKSSFMNLEITFFVGGKNDFKSLEIKEFVKKVISHIEHEKIKNNSNFNFAISKTKDKSKKLNIYE